MMLTWGSEFSWDMIVYSQGRIDILQIAHGGASKTTSFLLR